MSIETGIVARLNAVAAVTALTSNRIYADVIPQDAAQPAIAYQRISEQPFSSLGADTGKFEARFQFVLLAETKSQTVALTDAMKTALQRYQGAADDVTVLDCHLENILDQAYDLETGQVARFIDFKFIYE